MWNPVVILVLCLCSFSNAVPLGLKKNMDIVVGEDEPMLMLATDEDPRPESMISRLNLPSNATSIRADITDGFSCDNKTYGYYADVENECQIFHVCLPVTYADGKENTFRWSFICPEETVFSQDSFTCMRPEDMSIDCEESFKYYELNRNFGVIESEDTMPSAEDELDMEEMSRQPGITDLEENNQPEMNSAPVKKQTIKVQNTNRRKTQATRINDAQRRKVPPVKKTPPVPAVTAKPIEEQAPAVEQEVERTTVKYQSFTKRPSTLVKEPFKFELNLPATKSDVTKPELPIIRQDLYTQKRKRPQVYSATRFDAAVQTEPEPVLEDSPKSEILPEPKPEIVASPDQAEAQASEIAEVSIKPQVEKIAEPLPINPEVVESLPTTKNEPESKPEVEPLPENISSQAEVIEIPIQKVDQPLVVETPVVMAPIPEESKPSAGAEQTVKAEEENVEKEVLQAEQTMQDELTKTLETENGEKAEKSAPETPALPGKAADSEKVLLEPMPEADKVPEIAESESLMETVKFAEPIMPVSAESAEAETEEQRRDEPEVPQSEIPASLENQTPEQEPEIEFPAPEPGMGQHKTEIPKVEEKKEKEEAILDESPAPVPEMPLRSDSPTPETPLVVDLPVSFPEESQKVVPEPQSEPEKTSEPQAELSKVAEAPSVEKAPKKPVQSELPVEPVKALNPDPQTPAVSESEPQLTAEEIKAQAPEQVVASQSAEQMPAQPSAEDSANATSDNVDTQSMILDFIASLVNSENSNLNHKVGVPSDAQAEPEPAASEDQKVEQKYPVPQYMPMMKNNEEMYQIPVQVIQSPEPEPQLPQPAPEATRSELPVEFAPKPEHSVPAEPALPDTSAAKLPLSVDEVVELVKESLDTPAQKENLVQEPAAEQQVESQSEPQADSTEVKPIYHRYLEFGSNLLKTEPLSANDEDEPTIISATNNNSAAEQSPQPDNNTVDAPAAPELPKAADLPSEPEQLASEQKPAVNDIAAPDAPAADELSSEPASATMSRSLNRFKMDPRKRRFLFRSDAS